MKSIADRFWPKVILSQNGCWIWIAAADRLGYGRFWANGKLHLAHRFAYESIVGAIPDGLEPDHLCRAPACVNPEHLEPVTHGENLRRSPLTFLMPTHCKYGHVFDGRQLSGLKRRFCRKCNTRRGTEYRRRKRSILKELGA